MSLVAVAAGAVIYCLSDSAFAVNGISAYTCVIIYFVLIVVEMTYGKILTSNIKMESVWGPALYRNLLAAFPMFILGAINRDFDHAAKKLAEVPTCGYITCRSFSILGTLASEPLQKDLKLPFTWAAIAIHHTKDRQLRRARSHT